MAFVLKRIISRSVSFKKISFIADSSSTSVPEPIRIQRRFMPICSVLTSIQEKEVPKKFGKELVALIAEVLAKPENLVSVSVMTDMKMWRGTNDLHTATVNIWSIGVFDAKNNELYTPKFIKFFSEKLKLPTDRIALIFHPLEPEQAGHLIYQRQNEASRNK